MKRAFDCVFAGMALLALSPLMLWIAWAIKRDSAGPVLFLQTRVGRGEVPFQIYKFRTMRPANDGPLITVGEDNRITSVGRTLRHYKLDELPQLFNVLKGDMSLVGPRPEVPRYVACYSPEDRALMFTLRPGITDNASIEFRHESEMLAASPNPELTYIQEVLPIKIAHYRAYVQHHSFWGDLLILWKTLRAIAGH